MKHSFVGKLIKVGDSVGVVIPAKLLKVSGFAVGDYVECAVEKLTPETKE